MFAPLVRRSKAVRPRRAVMLALFVWLVPDAAPAAEPALVLADDPTANLDSASGAALMDLMRQLNEEKDVAFMFSTHDAMVMQRMQ